MKKRLAGEPVDSNEYRMVRADGSIFPALVFSTPVIKDAKPSGLRGMIVDISEQKKAEEAIRQSEEMANALLNGLPESAFLMKPNGIVIAANNTVAERLHTTVDALINNNIYPLVDANTANTRAKYAAQVVQTKKPVQFLDERFGKTIDNRIHPVFDTDGNVESLAIIGIDITQLRQNEILLIEADKRANKQRACLAQLFINEKIVHGEIDEALQNITEVVADTLEVQRASIWHLSDDKNELVCKDLFERADNRHSSGNKIDTKLFPSYFKAILSETRIYASDAQNDTRTRELADSYLIPLNIKSMLDAGVVVNGKLVGVICCEHVGIERMWYNDEESFISTISSLIAQMYINKERLNTETALLKAEAHLGSIFKASPAGIGLTKNRIITEINDYFCTLTGYSRDEIIGQNARMLYPSDENFEFVGTEKYRQIRESGIGTVETRFLTKKGEIRNILLSSSPLNPEDLSEGITFIAIDITDRKKAELAYRESQINFRALFEKGPIAVAYHQMIFDEKGEPVNYLFIDANKSYQELTGVNPVGKLVTEAFPGIENDPFNWIGTFGKVAKTGSEIRFQQFLESNQRWYDCVGYQYKPDHFVAAFLEITEHKKAELALLASEQRFAHVIDATEQGIWDWNIETNEVFYSEQWKKMIGYSDDELKNEFSTWVDHLHPDERESNIQSVENYLKNPTEHFLLEFRFRHKDGSYRWIHNKAAAVKNNEGKVIRMFGAHTDITERKKAEKALQHASENWNTTFRAIKSGVLLIDDKQRIIQSNEAFQDFVGKTVNELYQNCCYTFVHGTECAIDDCPFIRMKKSKKRETLELMMNGNYFEIIVDPIIDEHDQITGAVHILNDISQRKLDEKIQQILFEIARTSVSNNTLEDLLVVVRKELNKVMDTTNFFVALYQPETGMMTNVIFQEEKDSFLEWKAENSLSGEVVKYGKTILLNREEVIKYAAEHHLTFTGTPSEHWLGAPLKIGRQIIGAIVIQSYTKGTIYNQDNARLLEMIANELSLVIERNRMIDDLMHAKEKAEESDKLKSAFLANMSHEIRTPMNGILGFTSLLTESDLTSEEKDKYIDIIQKSGERMLNTVNDLIDISKIETGQMQLVSAKANLSDQIQNLYAFFTNEARNKGLNLVLKNNILPENATTETDIAKLDSIMTNLIKNAIKYTDKGSIEIGGDVKNQCFEFYVRDTGIGIPLHRQKAIFNRFEQADISDSHAYQGSGLGLTIARAYAEMLGGKIELESEPGVGSVFTVSIPVKSVSDNEKAVKKTTITTVENGMGNRKIKIQIAEDDDTGLEYLETILSEINCDIITASNGEEAVAQFKKNQDVDIILMDIRMPVMDGYQATQLIREINSNVYIIAQTAFALAGDREKAIEAGCNEYLTKPVNRKQLIQIISNYTNRES
ncbi:MAG: PAS domain S-box protein [Draconibacterium sp.]